MTFTYDERAEGLPYDPAAQVSSILHKLGASGPTINQAAYTYNGVGNRDSLTDRRGVQNFGYDNLDRFTSASHPLLDEKKGSGVVIWEPSARSRASSAMCRAC